jgi:hypothetical protein
MVPAHFRDHDDPERLSYSAIGTVYYQNYRGDNVFAPFAIAIGILAVTGSFRRERKRTAGSHRR